MNIIMQDKWHSSSRPILAQVDTIMKHGISHMAQFPPVVFVSVKK